MKYLIIIFSLTLFGCDYSIPKSGTKLDQAILWRTERFIPTNFGYSFLEVITDTSDLEAPRYLYLFDNQNNYVDGIKLYGTVQKIEKDQIEINKSMSGWTGEGSIGDIKIQYEEIKKISEGGSIDGSYIVDNIAYDPEAQVVTFSLRTSDTTYIWNEMEIIEKSKFYTDTLMMSIPISELDFEPYYKNQISYTYWDKSGTNNLTKRFYFNEKITLIKFYDDIEKNGL